MSDSSSISSRSTSPDTLKASESATAIMNRIDQAIYSAIYKQNMLADTSHDSVPKLRKRFGRTAEYLTKQMSNLKQEVNYLRNKIKDLEVENLKLSSELREAKSAQPEFLMNTMSELRKELNDRDQIGLLNDLDITGVPETEGESTTHIVMAVASKLNVEMQPQDVVFAQRAGGRRWRVLDMEGEAEGPPRARPIAVRFVRRATRDELLRQARLQRGTTSAELGLPPHPPRAVYVNERLTITNRQILDIARLAGRTLRWKYIWSKDGRIYARENEDSTVHLLRTIDDVNRVFKAATEENPKDD